MREEIGKTGSKKDHAQDQRALKHVIKLLSAELRKQDSMRKAERERTAAARVRALRENGAICANEGDIPTDEDIRIIQEALAIPYSRSQSDANAAQLRTIIGMLESQLNTGEARSLAPKEYATAKIKAAERI